jgi:hypothetical protein
MTNQTPFLIGADAQLPPRTGGYREPAESCSTLTKVALPGLLIPRDEAPPDVWVHAAGILIVVGGDGLGRSLPGVVIFQVDLPFPLRSSISTSDGERDHRQQQVKARQKPKEASNTSAKERANILGR